MQRQKSVTIKFVNKASTNSQKWIGVADDKKLMEQKLKKHALWN